MSSPTGIIRHYRAEMKTREPWKIASEELDRVYMMEERLGKLINLVEALNKLDTSLFERAIKADSDSKAAKVYKDWTKAFKGLLPLIQDIVEKAERFARKVDYFDGFKEPPKYSKEDFAALKNQLNWLVNPHPMMAGKLVKSEVAEGELQRGERRAFPPE